LSTYHEIFSKDSDLNIVLLEEPELGIHPHQLHQLMQFIKEQSKEKQIILTTHSPQVLDAIEPDELDRIIICHSEPKNGTQLNHLTDEQIKKAKKYMTSEAFLSDYWRFSDLEPA
jgi:predicted ATP-dependent endonuclease of OLD family